MTLRLFSIRRSMHFVPTSRRGVAGVFAAAGFGVLAAGGGLLTALSADSASPRAAIETAVPQPRSMPPTMVLLSPTVTSLAAENDVRELSFVLNGLYAAALDASGPVIEPDHPGLRAYSTGAVLDEIQQTLQERREQRVGKRPARNGALSTITITNATIDGDTATAVACQVDADELYDLDTGETLDDSVIVRELRVRYLKTSNGWKINQLEVSRMLSACG